MANPGGTGTKFVSVNLNKSYGPVSNRNNSSSTYGQAAAGRGRGGGGGGMVVLSRSKSTVQKPGPKLSVPPPLNLPSLRKENQRFDPSVPGGGSGGGAGLSGATRPNSAGVGWTKPATNLQDLSNDSVSVDKFDQNAGVVDSGVRGGSAYTPPSARFSTPSLAAHSMDKAAVLRGEDFPSLKAALPSGTSKEATHHQKQKKVLGSEESANDKTSRPSSSQLIYGNGSNEDVSESYGLGKMPVPSQARKAEDLFPGPFPLVRLNPRSDWADDERDTGHGLVERSKDYGNSNNENFWDRDFDMPRNRVLPHKPVDNLQRWGKREDDIVKTTISEIPKINPFVKTPNRESNSWRAPPPPKDFIRENGKDDRYLPPSVGAYSRVSVTVNQDFNLGRRDDFNRNTRDFYGNEQSNRYKGYGVQNNSVSKSSFSPSGKGFSTNDSILNFGREKRTFSNDESPATFDEQDPFSSGLVGVIKRKKDVKEVDFHDPVRESFEAELERVQKMQEQERQRIVEEQERVLEQARREEEERGRLIREEEENRRRVEDAAREAAWREEQERLEAIRRADELKIAREEEKRNMIMEEERRKQAAKQKLVELEAKMAKRETETVQDNTTSVMEKDNLESWEDSERMVERIMTPGSQSSREGGSGFVDRVKPINPWKRDVVESGNNSSFINYENGHFNPRRDSSVGGREFPKKSLHGGPSYMPVRNFYRNGNEENYAEDYTEFNDNNPEKYYPPYTEKLNSDGDELYPYGRSRYSVRQPRVLPPPSLAPIQKNTHRGQNERPGPSSFMTYNSSIGNESNMQMGYYSGSQDRVESSELAELEQQNNAKMLEKDSYSSVSVSSPPDSSTRLSHGDLDESGDSPTVSAKEANPIVAEDTELISDGDEDWSVENNEELQEQEEYEDGYQEEDEVHEGDEDNVCLNQELDDLNLAEKDSPDMMENLVLGFDDGVEVRLNSSYGEESAFIDQEKPDNGQKDEILTSRCIQGDGMVISDSTVQPANTVDLSSASNASHSSIGQTVMSPFHVGSTPTDLPIKLQFGLFTGPPLIPSPIPAIQIGSIQMPLHIHPSLNPSVNHQSQAPLFQFGKLRFTTPISQGIVPIAPQMSFVQPNVQPHYNMNQNFPIQPKPEGLANNKIKDDVSSSSKVSKANENKYMTEDGEREQGFSSQENYRKTNGMHNYEDSRGLRAHGQQSGFKSKRFAYVARNSNVRSAFPANENSRLNSGGFQRRPRRTAQRIEFRVRENFENRSSFNARNVGVFDRHGPKKGLMGNKPAEKMVDLEPPSSFQQMNMDPKVENSPQMKIVSDEDVDAPLQSGIVRVFKQPGIEAPSDEDDFIQVRSKRQMLNDRREQREKEIKAKSRVVKAPRRVGPITPSATIPRSSNAKSAIYVGESSKNVVPKGRILTNVEAPKIFSTAVSQQLAPIGPPAMTSDLQNDKKPQIIKSFQTGANSAISNSAKDIGSGLVFETKSKIIDDVQTSLGSWGNSNINQQVMALTQTQLDEAMRPDRLDEHVTGTSGHSSSVVNANMPSSKDKSFSSTASPVNSLLAGEKIQFGAVTSPTVLPSSSRAASHVIRAPVSSRSDIKISHSLSNSESDCSNMLAYEKQKNQHGDARDLEDDAEAEAEAAASAVAVAAMGSDESVSVADTNGGFRCPDINGVSRGMAGDQQLSSQSRAEESLSVALPADLSVETPQMSSWPPLPSPQSSSSGQILSHFPGGPSSPFPFYEMSPMMARPIFAFGPHDESGGSQSQAQKSSVSGPLGSWQQFHSGPDSFYGTPAGFPSPYMGPHGAIPGVQGPPHMVVYNPFPVGQFGQVGLSFMGTTYIPSGKQPDWKHNSNREGEIINNMNNMGSGQHSNPSGMGSPVQHLGPPSQLLPMPSPVTLFDVSHFQSAPDASGQGGWPHVTSSPLHSAPLSTPHQLQETSVLNYSQINNRFSESRTSIPSTDSTSTQFPSEQLRLVNSSASEVAVSSIQSSTITHTAKSDNAQSGGNNTNNGNNMNTYKTRASQPRNFPSQHQYNHYSSGYGFQRNRMGYNNGRNNNYTANDKSFSPKIKQVYVAKQTTNNGSTVG